MKTIDRSLRGLEKKRGLFFRIGLVVSLILTFFAFEWETKIPREVVEPPGIWDDVDELLMPVTLRKEIISLPEVKQEIRKPDIRKQTTQPIIVPDNSVTKLIPVDTSYLADLIPIKIPDESDSADPTPVLIPEFQPEFPGGDEGLLKYLQKAIKYPDRARENGITGAAYINFVIDENGNATAINCKLTTNAMFSEEAMRVIRDMPKWKPGRQGGKNVSVIMTLPVTFRLL